MEQKWYRRRAIAALIFLMILLVAVIHITIYSIILLSGGRSFSWKVLLDPGIYYLFPLAAALLCWLFSSLQMKRTRRK